MKRILSVFLCGVILLPAVLCLSGCSVAPAAPFSVLTRADCPATEIRLWKAPENDRYYLFLPADADRNALTVITAAANVSVDGAKLENGETTDLFGQKDQFRLTAAGKTGDLCVMQSASLPSVFIRTASGSLEAIHADREHKERADVTILSDADVLLNAAPLTHIKGRGHSTWTDSEKKPYNIKFEEKTDVLGMGAAKNWALLADDSILAYYKEPIAMDLARQTSLAFTPESRHVDLYINGEYRGIYRISEKVEVSKQRLNIDDLGEANKAANEGKTLSEFTEYRTDRDGATDNAAFLNPGDRRWYALDGEPSESGGGYLLEITDEPDAESAFCTDRGQMISLTSPKYASKKQTDGIADLYQRAEDALYSEDGYNKNGEYYADFFDPESFADAYILREFMMDYDAGVSSTFFYKPTAEERFFAGPVWDFEGALPMGLVSFGVNFSENGQWWANSCPHISMVFRPEGKGYYPDHGRSIPCFFAAMYRHEDFRLAVRERWRQLSSVFASVPVSAKELLLRLSPSVDMNVLRWTDGDASDAAAAVLQQKTAFSEMINLLTRRKGDLDKGFSEDAAMLYYDANGGEGVMFHNEILSVGERATLKTPDSREQNALLSAILLTGEESFSHLDGLLSPPSENDAFAGWNTEPDGSGEMYQPGDGYTVTQTTNVLYAQWEK